MWRPALPALLPLLLSACRPGGAVIGGQQTTIELHPHLVAIDFQGDMVCGGALLSPKTVITAASCFFATSATVAARPSKWRTTSSTRTTTCTGATTTPCCSTSRTRFPSAPRCSRWRWPRLRTASPWGRSWSWPATGTSIKTRCCPKANSARFRPPRSPSSTRTSATSCTTSRPPSSTTARAPADSRATCAALGTSVHPSSTGGAAWWGSPYSRGKPAVCRGCPPASPTWPTPTSTSGSWSTSSSHDTFITVQKPENIKLAFILRVVIFCSDHLRPVSSQPATLDMPVGLPTSQAGVHAAALERGHPSDDFGRCYFSTISPHLGKF
ncbi:mucin-2-like isoform X1 [Thrips palmi]|uniref:Mucin-2-like isoform X1 n=1 Tax=Thrips palmi TaxID=161013 RepID=A0A6P9AAF8_THRPL|nr:mucin-2-like isoform X1 [Thrips palmi]